MDRASVPLGVRLISLFFAFGASMSGLTAFLLLFPGSHLDVLWRLNPRARADLTSMGPLGVYAMGMVCVSCVISARELWRGTRLGLNIALAMLILNVGADLVNAFALHDWRTLIGVPIGGAMILYLMSQRHRFISAGV
jgi:hypothetical protein